VSFWLSAEDKGVLLFFNKRLQFFFTYAGAFIHINKKFHPDRKNPQQTMGRNCFQALILLTRALINYLMITRIKMTFNNA